MKLLTPSELSEITGIHVGTIQRLSLTGKIPAIRIGGQWRYNPELIEQWMLTTASNARHSILAVDDDPDVLEFLGRTLSHKLGHDVVKARSGERAIQLLEEEDRFSLLLLDLSMEPISGVDVLKWLHEREKEMAVLVITGYPDSDLMSKALEYDVLSVIKKPVDAKTLIRAVRLLLHGLQSLRKTG
jgi:excisionase family DNA binding protein